MESPRNMPYADSIIKFEQKVNDITMTNIPVKIKIKRETFSYALLILIFFILIINARLNKFLKRLYGYEREKKQILEKEEDIDLDNVETVFSNVAENRLKQRHSMLDQIQKIKKQITKSATNYTFLSIDIYDSTNMKIGEKTYDIEYSFNKYIDMVKAIFIKNNVLSEAWTPDGVMACFKKIEHAIRAAKMVLKNLDKFNEDVKTINTFFHVRCGINSGLVNYDPDMPLELYTDRTIDIAGHMQKYAAIDTIYIPSSIIKTDKEGFHTTDKQVNELNVSVWHKEKPSSDL